MLADPFIGECLAQGAWGVMEAENVRAVEKTFDQFEAYLRELCDQGQTFLMEVFAGHAGFTLRAVTGGHFVVQPTGLDHFVNLRSPQDIERTKFLPKKIQTLVFDGFLSM